MFIGIKEIVREGGEREREREREREHEREFTREAAQTNGP